VKTTTFRLERFFNVLKRDLFFQYKGAIITISIILGIYFLAELISFATSGSTEVFMFVNGLFIAGIIATSVSFNEFHDKTTGVSALSYPASTAEKFLSKWSITTVVYIVAALVIYFVFSAFMKGVFTLIFGHGPSLFNPLDFRIWQALAGYLWVHSVFFFGAAFFKKAAFIKTLLAVILTAIVIAIFAGLVVGAMFFGVIRDVIVNAAWGDFSLSIAQVPVMLRFGGFLETLSTILFGYCLPIALWVLSYLRFREIEVR
jgi:hypothetical protein